MIQHVPINHIYFQYTNRKLAHYNMTCNEEYVLLFLLFLFGRDIDDIDNILFNRRLWTSTIHYILRMFSKGQVAPIHAIHRLTKLTEAIYYK